MTDIQKFDVPIKNHFNITEISTFLDHISESFALLSKNYVEKKNNEGIHLNYDEAALKQAYSDAVIHIDKLLSILKMLDAAKKLRKINDEYFYKENYEANGMLKREKFLDNVFAGYAMMSKNGAFAISEEGRRRALSELEAWENKLIEPLRKEIENKKLTDNDAAFFGQIEKTLNRYMTEDSKRVDKFDMNLIKEDEGKIVEDISKKPKIIDGQDTPETP